MRDEPAHAILAGGTRIADLPSREKPRERLLGLGAGALSTAELLAILVGSGQPGLSALDLGHALLARFDLEGLARASAEELCGQPGCGPARAVRIKAALELGRRLLAPSSEERRRIRSPGDAAAMLSAEMADFEQEHLRVLLLNVRHEVLGVHEVYKGSISASPVRVAEVYREAIRRNAAAIIVAHNHPSGDPAPSPDDVRVTRQFVEAGRLLDIELLDHVVVARRGWVSMRERGLGFGGADALGAVASHPMARRLDFGAPRGDGYNAGPTRSEHDHVRSEPGARGRDPGRARLSRYRNSTGRPLSGLLRALWSGALRPASDRAVG